MTTLAPKLPWRHAFAGGYPGVGGQALPTDPDAIDYLERLAAADGAPVEVGVAQAIDAFVRGCKADATWDAIKASCIMAGARTLTGALVPLKTPYGDENFNPAATPAIQGATGSYSVATRTMTNSASAEYASYPRFNFDYSLTQNKRYRIDGVLSGDLAAVYGVYLGSTPLTYSPATGVISGTYTATDATTLFRVYLSGQAYTSASVTIESLSIREDSFTPTSYNFTSTDYNRGLLGTDAGLKGDGSSTYLDSGRANDADGQNDNHNAVYISTAQTAARVLLGAGGSSSGANTIGGYDGTGGAAARSRNSAFDSQDLGEQILGLVGTARSSAGGYILYSNGGETEETRASQTPSTDSAFIFARSDAGSPTSYSDARLAFYSIGSSLSLSSLDARVSNLVNSIKFTLATGLNPAGYEPETIAYILAGYENGGSL